METAQVPKLEEYTILMYNEILNQPTIKAAGSEVGMVFVKLTEAYVKAGIPSPYYSSIRRLLFESEVDGVTCLTLLKRGGRIGPSLVQINRAPVPEDFAREDLTERPHAATLALETAERVQRLEAWRDGLSGLNVVEVLRDYEKRLAALELKLEETTTASEGEK